ncbi:hypothetical protein ACWGJB_28340 [Streptomyces sp. NPDC054813]
MTGRSSMSQTSSRPQPGAGGSGASPDPERTYRDRLRAAVSAGAARTTPSSSTPGAK